MSRDMERVGMAFGTPVFLAQQLLCDSIFATETQWGSPDMLQVSLALRMPV